MGFPCSSVAKDSACNAGDLGSIPGSGGSPGEEKWQPTPIFLPGKSQGQRSLVGPSLWSSPINIGSCCCCCFSRFTHVRVSLLPLWTAAGQAPLSVEFSKQEYQGGLPLPAPRDLSDPGIKPMSSVLQLDSLSLSHQGGPYRLLVLHKG